MRRNSTFLGLALVALLLVGCGENGNRSGDAATSGGAAAAGSDYLLAVEPPGAVGVVDARGTVQNDEEITVVGRVGGDPDPFVKGTAAFTIVDLSLKPCPADEGCPTPWDYCCDLNKLRSHKAMVQVVDQQGSLVTVDAKELLGVEPLDTLVVRGRARRDEAGNLTVLADGVYRRQ